MYIQLSSLCHHVLCKVFPPVPWSGQFRSHLAVTSSSEDNTTQLQCLCPNPDHATPPYIHALNVVCQLESSSKWPDEVEAIQQIKTAFYIKMSELIGRDHSVVSSPTFSHLDILKVHYPTESMCYECFCPRMDLYLELR